MVKQVNYLKITKLLNLTMSENDHEALSALRKVNEIVKNGHGYWDDFFEYTYNQIKKHILDTDQKKEDLKENIREMFDYVFDQPSDVMSDSSWDFISSIWKFWVDKHYLTEKQKSSLHSVYKGVWAKNELYRRDSSNRKSTN